MLLKKLDHYGTNESAKRLMHSYFPDGFQFVEFNRYKSTYLPNSTGVPQTSTLAQSLCLIYINDLLLMSKLFSMLIYADDTTLSCNINDKEEAVQLIYLSIDTKSRQQYCTSVVL